MCYNECMNSIDVKPYGAWVSPIGDIIPVREAMCHLEYAYAILGIAEDTKRKYPIYQIMYRLGYIKLTYTQNNDYGYTLEYTYNQKIRECQSMYVECAEGVSPTGWHKEY